jgi:hypothetical protein
VKSIEGTSQKLDTMNPTFKDKQIAMSEKPVTLDQMLAAGYSLQEIAKKKDKSERRLREECSETSCHKSEALKQLRTVKAPVKPVIETVSPPAAKKATIVVSRMNMKPRSHRHDAVFTTRSKDSKPHVGGNTPVALPEVPSFHQANMQPKALTSKMGARCA